jgi:hypothetical protein
MDLVQLIYSSRPFGFDDAVLNGILLTSRRNNQKSGVTGALICRSDVYLQLLEGPKSAVEATFAKILGDDRHLEVERHAFTLVADRLFPGWSMRDDPARSWMWTPTEVAAGAIKTASYGQLLGVFSRLASERT